MKKITKSQKAARIIITTQNLLFIICLVALLILAQYTGTRYKLFQIPGWFYLIFVFVIQPILLIILTFTRIKMGDDKTILQKMQIKRSEKIAQRKSKIKTLAIQIQEESCLIQNISSVIDQACSFKIDFIYEIIDKAMPVIYLNGIKLTIKKLSEFAILCYAEKALNSTMEKLHFKSGKSEFIIDNPYFMGDSISSGSIIWQCEGNTKERNIFINGDYFPHKSILAIYTFVFSVEGEVIGSYSGKYIPERKSIVINIGNIKKCDILNKKCIIRPVFGTTKIQMPKPVVVSRNNQMIKEINFYH